VLAHRFLSFTAINTCFARPETGPARMFIESSSVFGLLYQNTPTDYNRNLRKSADFLFVVQIAS